MLTAQTAGRALTLLLRIMGSSSLLVVDWLEGRPLSWTLWEGPCVILFGGAILWLTRLDMDAHRARP